MSLTRTSAGAPHGGRPVLAAGAPLETARGAVVMLHGRGGSAADIISLAAYFRAGDIAFLAPEAAANVWYPQRFMEPRAINEPALSSALGTVAALADDLNAAGTSSPTGAKISAASSGSGAGCSELPAQTQPSDRAKTWPASSPSRVKASTRRPCHIATCAMRCAAAPNP